MSVSIPPSSHALMNSQDIHDTNGLRRTFTGLTDDDNAFDLGTEEEEFELQIATTTGHDARDTIKSQFEGDIDDARTLFPKKPESVEQKKQAMTFVVERTAEWGKMTWEGQTFLHHLAYYDYNNRKPFVNLSWLMTRAIHKLPHLVGFMDNTKRTPLTVALSKGNAMFTHAACINLPPETTPLLTEALRSECVKNRKAATCLHTALDSTFTDEKTREKIIRKMCNFVPEEMFAIEVSQGRVPLHIAIEYGRCCKAQVGIVNEMLLRGPEALTVEFTPSFSERPLSIYQYYQRSRRRATKSPTSQQKKPPQNTAAHGKDHRVTTSNLNNTESKSVALKMEKGAMVLRPNKLQATLPHLSDGQWAAAAFVQTRNKGTDG
ncbi:hypothetical protein CGRA01v4_06484 [Colletotrichum graminicola]|uniref:Ankyrin repeat protein n=1 Tax=Colletotrichum graminicola (strain M1.001 / M2 / FGSC 10212) TaxID=645133 RepID=E3Q275_COLGM|nr:uncharacterized protein GLRG_00320 [Colletotrichum graminicola M1.001]EFQ25176.1 hypothetical protein GLRG_00320 [Colletotrichum graminicola M1.001]WDK15203.1 hypothetical protein CGRA01v4_06484 [Colletotrichum graminicola]